MAKVSTARLLILSVFLAITACLIHAHKPVIIDAAKNPLNQSFESIPGWRSQGSIPLDIRISDELKLDDYLFRTYKHDSSELTLYIGYYNAVKKVGAAHDPLVCFQGQGWKITNRDTGVHLVGGDPKLKISYSVMIAERELDREVILYWFQVNDKAFHSTPRQKLAIALDSFFESKGVNAFVRINAPVAKGSAEEINNNIIPFIDAFYPVLLRHIAGK